MFKAIALKQMIAKEPMEKNERKLQPTSKFALKQMCPLKDKTDTLYHMDNIYIHLLQAEE